MRDILATCLFIVFVSAVVWTGWRHLGERFEWTFDGVHHVLILGAAK